MLYKENQDILTSVDVFASDRTVRGIIFSLLVKYFIETVYVCILGSFLKFKFIIKFVYS